MNYNKITKTLLTCSVLGLAVVANPVQADLFAYSKLEVTNFIIEGSDGSPLDASTDFSSLAFTSSADMDGTLSGTAGFNDSVANSITGIDFTTKSLSTTGDANPLSENGFEFLTGAQGADYVAADQLQVGSPLANQTGFPVIAGADVGQIAVGSLSTTVADGSANVNNGLEASFTFSLAQAGGVSFTGDVETYLEAFASAGEIFPGKASAATSFFITIEDLQGGTGFVFDSRTLPVFSLFNQTASVNPNGFAFDIQTCGDFNALFGGCGTQFAGSFDVTTNPLLASNLYQLTIRSNANIDIARAAVPEPATLGLLGFGLLGLVMGHRRRRA